MHMIPYVNLHPCFVTNKIDMELIEFPIYVPEWIRELAIARLSGGKYSVMRE